MTKRNGKSPNGKGIKWTNIRVKLGALKPWADNPRMSSAAQAKRLLESWHEFGQIQTVAVGPALDVYDGHQRLSALLTIHGASYEIDARQSSRALTDKERRRLVIMLHAGAVGAWNWDALAGWDDEALMSAGMDQDLLRQLNTDAMALRMLMQAETDPYAEWEGMPEFEQEDKEAYKSIKVNFANQDDYESFARLINQTLTDSTRSIWHPYKKPDSVMKYSVEDES